MKKKAKAIVARSAGDLAEVLGQHYADAVRRHGGLRHSTLPFSLLRKSAEPRAEISGVERGLLQVHRVPDAGNGDQPAIRHGFGHPLQSFPRPPWHVC